MPTSSQIQWACCDNKQYHGKPRLVFNKVQYPSSKTSEHLLPSTCWNQGEWPSRHTGWQVMITTGLRLGRSEVLRSLRHYLWAWSQRYQSIVRSRERSVEKRSAQRHTLERRERTVVNKRNMRTVSIDRHNFSGTSESSLAKEHSDKLFIMGKSKISWVKKKKKKKKYPASKNINYVTFPWKRVKVKLPE